MTTDPLRPGESSKSRGDPPPGTSPYKSRGGVARLRQALKYSFSGLADAVRREAAFRQELLLVAVLAPIASFFPFSSVERVMLIGSLLLLLIVELLNSAMEATVDRISIEPHPLAGRAKDLGSAAVMLTLVLVALTWLAIAGPVLAGLLLSVN